MTNIRLAGPEGVHFLAKAMLAERATQAPVESPKTIASEELFGKCRQVFIKHGDGLYRLLITRTGKLILNK